MYSKLFFINIILICGFSTVTSVDLSFENDLLAQKGLGWPSHLNVVKGNEALMKLRISLANQQACIVIDPSGVRFDVKQPPNNRLSATWDPVINKFSSGEKCSVGIKSRADNISVVCKGRYTKCEDKVRVDEKHCSVRGRRRRGPRCSSHIVTTAGATLSKCRTNNRYQKWGDGCGIRVKNIIKDDEGRWRLTASRVNDSIVGWIELSVLEATPQEATPPISLQDGETHAKVDLSSTDNAYCVVAKPFAESSLVSGQCSVTLDRTTRAVQGNWQVFLGLPGRVSEVQTSRHVTVQTERLDVGYVHDAANKLHLYCNILHSNKEITFCRFQRTSNQYGYNVVDGLSDGSYSYYGDGFMLKQCGITIEKPSAKDYSTWRCSVGVQIQVGNVMQQQTPMQALISVVAPNSLQSLRMNEDFTIKVFVQKDSPFTITCDAGVSLRYCWFQHPNGTQFTPVRLASEQQLFWYTGESLEVGECGITFAHSNDSDNGEWSCYMGPSDSTGIEIKDKVEVRVTGPLAANLKDVPVSVGDNATLYCQTSNGRRALKYCRFLSPQFVGMSLDSTVTPENAVLNRFYFTPGRDLNFGDCSLSISSVQEEDIGIWTCAAVVDNEILESRDTIRVFIGNEPRPRPRLQAGIIGASAGLSVLVVLLIGYVTYKRDWIQHLLNSIRNRRNTLVHEDVTLHTSSFASGSISSRSTSSRSSGEGTSNSA